MQSNRLTQEPPSFIHSHDAITNLERIVDGQDFRCEIVAIKFHTQGRKNHSWVIITTDESGSRTWDCSKDKDKDVALLEWKKERINKRP